VNGTRLYGGRARETRSRQTVRKGNLAKSWGETRRKSGELDGAGNRGEGESNSSETKKQTKGVGKATEGGEDEGSKSET